MSKQTFRILFSVSVIISLLACTLPRPKTETVAPTSTLAAQIKATATQLPTSTSGPTLTPTAQPTQPPSSGGTPVAQVTPTPAAPSEATPAPSAGEDATPATGVIATPTGGAEPAQPGAVLPESGGPGLTFALGAYLLGWGGLLLLAGLLLSWRSRSRR